MEYLETKVVFESDMPELAEELISTIFYDFGLQGVVVEQPGGPDEPCRSDEMESREFQENTPAHHAVIGYLPVDTRIQRNCRLLEERLMEMEKTLTVSSTVQYRTVAENDWAHCWKQFFKPENITQTITVRPTWQEYFPRPHEIVLEIDPGMAFGTGTHPTTAMCIQLIEKYIRKDDRFLDVGTGSGIQMIASAKLGAKTVWGTDLDQSAVEIARANLRLNGVGPERFQVAASDLIRGIKGCFDLISANILSEIILRLLTDLPRIMEPGAVFICSGIIEDNRETVVEKMKATGFEILDILSRKEWVAIAGKFAGC